MQNVRIKKEEGQNLGRTNDHHIVKIRKDGQNVGRRNDGQNEGRIRMIRMKAE